MFREVPFRTVPMNRLERRAQCFFPLRPPGALTALTALSVTQIAPQP